MSECLVYYRFYHDNIDTPDHSVDSINVKIAHVYADNQYEAELSLLDYFGDNIIVIIKSEKV